MNAHSPLEIHPNRDGFGAEIRGCDLARGIDDRTRRAIMEAWATHGVLRFPDQQLDAAALAAVSAAFGPFGHDPFVAPIEDHPHVIEVRHEPGETAPIFGSLWHSDWSFQPAPPSATLLYGSEIPPAGGDTLFADACRAFESLSPVMQEMLTKLRGVHSAAPAYGPRGLFSRDDDTRSMRIIVSADAERTHAHPLVRTHPVSGRRALYVNHVYTIGIEGMRADESRALLEFLFAHMTRPEFVWRHRWQPGVLLMWDNRCVVHMAEGGYEGHRRLMYRTTLAGETPVPA